MLSDLVLIPLATLIKAIAFLHDQKIVHLDIKPHNLVAESTASTFAKLYVIDYSISRWYADGDPCIRGWCGTRGWTAPEVVDGQSWDPRAADVWAMTETLKFLAEVRF